MHNPLDLTGRSVLVTGASSGLGRATAILMSRLGARVLLLGRSVQRLQETLDRLEGAGHQLVSFDLENVEGIPDLLADQATRFASFSGLVHSAGALTTKPLYLCRPEDYESLYRLHVVAAAQFLRGLTRRGVASPEGCSAVLVGSVMSCVAAPGKAAYAASKAAVLGLVRAAALELVRHRIRVNAVLPGSFQSEMTEQDEKRLTEEQIQEIKNMHPLGVGRAEDVANAVAFLVADSGRWITGTGLIVDGGYMAH